MTEASYDYVIVGGGSAGSALANRLGAGGDHTVLSPYPCCASGC